MSMREQGAPEFTSGFRGYDRAQVDEYVVWLRDLAIQAEDRAGRAEAALAQCRRELAASPTTAGISQRLAAMLQLATEEADEIRARAQAESEATVTSANQEAKRTLDEANQLRDAIQREIDELSAVREELLQRLIELGGEVVGATERFRGYPPGKAPLSSPRVELYDAEADVDQSATDDAATRADEPPTDPAAAVSER